MKENNQFHSHEKRQQKSNSSFRQLPENPVSVFYNASADFLGTGELGNYSKIKKKNGKNK